MFQFCLYHLVLPQRNKFPIYNFTPIVQGKKFPPLEAVWEPGSSFVLVYTLELLHVKSRKPGVFSLFFFPSTLHHEALSLTGIYNSISLLPSEGTNCLHKLSPSCRECVNLSQNNLGSFPTNFRWWGKTSPSPLEYKLSEDRELTSLFITVFQGQRTLKTS